MRLSSSLAVARSSSGWRRPWTARAPCPSRGIGSSCFPAVAGEEDIDLGLHACIPQRVEHPADGLLSAIQVPTAAAGVELGGVPTEAVVLGKPHQPLDDLIELARGLTE